MTVTVVIGYTTASTFAQRCFTRGTSAHAHHSAHAQCTLGIAANWFEILLTAPELNDQNAGSWASVSKKSKRAGIRRGGSSGKNATPTSATAVAMPRVFRHNG